MLEVGGSHSRDRMRGHERCTEDRDKSPLYSSMHRYDDKCSARAGTIRFATMEILLAVIMTVGLLSILLKLVLLWMVVQYR